MPVSTKQITGYPNFAALKDREIAQQVKLTWDAIHQLSSDLASVAAAVNTISGQITVIQARLTAGGL